MGTRLAMLALIGLGCGMAAAQAVPLPRPKPPVLTAPHASGALPGVNSGGITAEPTDCDRRLAAIAAIELLPRLIGPGACGGADLVELDAVLLPDKARVAVEPAALLNCSMAESLAAWLRDEVAPDVAKFGSPLRSIENYGSYECRFRNRRSSGKISEHAHGDAIDVRAIHLADGRRVGLVDATADADLRRALRDSACHRFTTVLGPGADIFHVGHVHLDVIQRLSGYRICEWDVGAPPAAKAVAAHFSPGAVGAADAADVPLPKPRPARANVSVKHVGKL